MTTCNKAQANTSRPEEARLRLPDPGHNLPRDGEPKTYLQAPFFPFFFHQCWPSRGSSMPNPNGNPFDLPLPSSRIHPPQSLKALPVA